MNIKLMKVALLCLILTACAGGTSMDAELDKTIQTFNQSLLNKDTKLLDSILKQGLYDVEALLGGDAEIYHLTETLSTEINDNIANVKIRTEFEELIEFQLQSYYIDLIGYIQLTLEYTDSKWIITDIDMELDPTTTMPPRP